MRYERCFGAGVNLAESNMRMGALSFRYPNAEVWLEVKRNIIRVEEVV